MDFIQGEKREQFQLMSLEIFISQDNNNLYFIGISTFKNIIFQSFLSDRQFLISKSKKNRS